MSCNEPYLPQPSPARASGAERRRLDDFRPLDRNTQDIGEPMHEQLVLCHPAVDLEHDRPQPIGGHRFEQIVGLVDHAVERRACDLAAARGTRQSDQGAAGVGIPIGRAEAGKGGHQVHSAAIADRSGQGFDVGGARYETQSVAQPLNRGAR